MGEIKTVTHAARWFSRGLLQVTLVAANVRFIAAHATGAMFLTGMAISLVWWGNTSGAARNPSDWVGRIAYGTGAGIGTVVGAQLAGWL